MRTARTLSRLGGRRKRTLSLPSLFFVTDPVRTPDPAAIAARLPRGCGIIYRGFGAKDAPATAKALQAIARRRGLTLLIGAGHPYLPDVGVHLPERMATQARRFKRPGRLVTAAAHDAAAIRRARLAGCDAVLVSPVFPSRSGLGRFCL